MNRIRIEDVPGKSLSYRRIFLDDIDISRFVRGIDIKMRVGDIDEVQLTVIGRLELPDELRAIIDAKVDGSEIYRESAPYLERDYRHL